MARIRLVHWKAAEAAALLDALRGGGHSVEYDEKVNSTDFRAFRQSPPDAFVIDLSRMPSHGREVAIYFRGQKAMRQVPILFVDGEPEKVAGIQKVLPDAVYTTSARVRSALREALKNRPASPVVPMQMMERYATRTVAQKLGIAVGTVAAVIDPPRNYAAVIGELPEGAVLEENPAAACAVTLWFVHGAQLPAVRKLAARTKLWILWRKGGVVTQHVVRESAAAVGLVDYKICALHEGWSGMLFAVKKA